ncbi:MAG: M13 family metallopeptidase, partial [Polyangia bacterium]
MRSSILLVALSLSSVAVAAPDETAVESFTPAAVDHAVDPCGDFYAYACNPWLKAHPIPPDLGAFGRGTQVALRTLHELRDLLEAVRTADPKRNAVESKVGDYYAACMDEAASGKKGRATVAALVARVEALPSLAELPPLLAELHLDAAASAGPGSPLFSASAGQDLDNASMIVTNFDQGGMGLPDRDYYLKSDAKSVETQQKYRAHLQKLLELFGEPPARAKADAETSYAIETALARGAMDLVARRDPRNLNHKYDDAKLRAMMRSFDLGAYQRALAAPTPHHHLVLTPDFFAALDALLRTRPLADIKTYLRVWIYNAYAAYLGGAFENQHFAFYRKTIGGAKEIMPRWKRCTRAIDGDLGESLGQLYVAKYFPPTEKKATNELVRAIESAFDAEIGELPWMSAATKSEAKKKLHGILDKIGYPDKFRDYGKVRVVRDDWLANALEASRFEVRRWLDKIGKPIDRLEWTMTPPTVDAYYDAQMNTINFPAGILQPPFFDGKLDDAVNLGEIGAVIGHELTHGFDDQGRMFDATGNLRDWWTPADGKKFEERAQCTADQYSSYKTVGDLKINGKLTLGENT